MEDFFSVPHPSWSEGSALKIRDQISTKLNIFMYDHHHYRLTINSYIEVEGGPMVRLNKLPTTGKIKLVK